MASGFSADTLLVDYNVMLQKASAVDQKIREMRNTFSDLETSVNKTKAYWIGEAGDAYRAYFMERKPEAEEIFKRLSEHVRDLNEMAGVYSSTEKEITAMAEDLPSDVII